MLSNVGKKVAGMRPASSGLGTKSLIGAAALLGLSSGQFKNANDAAMETAFGDPNADEYFLGGEGLTPTKYLTAGLVDNAPGVTSAATGGIGAAIGAAAGFGIGGGMMALGGRKAGLKAMGRVGGLLGGAAIGGAIGAAAPLASMIGNNREFYSSSAYSRGSAMQAASTGAYGDIVLGMHNSRRG